MADLKQTIISSGLPNPPNIPNFPKPEAPSVPAVPSLGSLSIPNPPPASPGLNGALQKVDCSAKFGVSNIGASALKGGKASLDSLTTSISKAGDSISKDAQELGETGKKAVGDLKNSAMASLDKLKTGASGLYDKAKGSLSLKALKGGLSDLGKNLKNPLSNIGAEMDDLKAGIGQKLNALKGGVGAAWNKLKLAGSCTSAGSKGATSAATTATKTAEKENKVIEQKQEVVAIQTPAERKTNVVTDATKLEIKPTNQKIVIDYPPPFIVGKSDPFEVNDNIKIISSDFYDIQEHALNYVWKYKNITEQYNLRLREISNEQDLETREFFKYIAKLSYDIAINITQVDNEYERYGGKDYYYWSMPLPKVSDIKVNQRRGFGVPYYSTTSNTVDSGPRILFKAACRTYVKEKPYNPLGKKSDNIAEGTLRFGGNIETWNGLSVEELRIMINKSVYGGL